MRAFGRIGAVGALVAAVLLAVPTAASAKPQDKPAGDSGSTTWQVVFSVQPSVVQRGVAMDPAVVVMVEKAANGHLVDYDGAVTLAYSTNLNGAAAPAEITELASGGVATFSNLVFTDVGFGFQLTASVTDPSGTTVTSAPSAPFDVVDQLVRCPENQGCSTDSVTSGLTYGSSVADAAATAGILTATSGGLGAGGGGALTCTSRGGVVTFNSDRSQTITVNVSNAGVSGRGKIEVCAGANYPFVTADGSEATYQPANADYEGVLPACPPTGAVLCVRYTNRSTKIDTAVIFAPAGDPHITF
jgi:hypothetical protein